MTSGERLLEISSLPSGNSARNLFLNIDCPDVPPSGDGEPYFVTMDAVTCDLQVETLGANINDQIVNCDLQSMVLNAIIVNENLDADLDNKIDGEIKCLQ